MKRASPGQVFWYAHLSFAAMRNARSISYTETPLQKKEQLCVWRVRYSGSNIFHSMSAALGIVRPGRPELAVRTAILQQLPGRPGRATIPLNVPLVAFTTILPLLQIHHRGE